MGVETIPVGLCQCGCGRKTGRVLGRSSGNGYRVGDFRRFVKGHGRWAKSSTDFVIEDHGHTTPCWIWTGTLNNRGYGRVNRPLKSRERHAHRFYYERRHGSIPDRMCVLHRCDVPPCVNPDHLFLGTLRDNSLDMRAKGRHVVMNQRPALGEANGSAKLTSRQVRAIRANCRKRGDQTRLAREYGVSLTTINTIVSGKTWRHLT